MTQRVILTCSQVRSTDRAQRLYANRLTPILLAIAHPYGRVRGDGQQALAELCMQVFQEYHARFLIQSVQFHLAAFTVNPQEDTRTLALAHDLYILTT